MATLYVENIPDELYEALRARAKSQRRSLAAETIRILEQNVPTPAELASREKFYRKIQQIRRRAVPGGRFAPLEHLLREDRDR